MNDVLEVRIALENLSIENACARMTEEQLGDLWKAAKNFEDTMAEGNLVKLAEADVAFHEGIYKSSDNRRLNQVWNISRMKKQETFLLRNMRRSTRRSRIVTSRKPRRFLISISRTRERRSSALSEKKQKIAEL